MGDLASDTVVEGGAGRYRAKVSPAWAVWGPHGGYMSVIALRAAAAETEFTRPVSLAVHFLAPAEFDVVDLEVTALVSSRRVASRRVSVTQGERRILEALVWFGSDTEAPEHDQCVRPDVPAPDEVEEWTYHYPVPFWDNISIRGINVRGPYDEVPYGAPAVWQSWHRLHVPTFEDPILDAARYVVVADIPMWAAMGLPNAADAMRWMAPSLDLTVQFHQAAPESEWLLARYAAPVNKGGIGGGTGEVWSDDGRLLASAGSQLIWRRRPR